jgi:integrase
MEYLQPTEVNALLAEAYKANPIHHQALLAMYATGTRVSQVLRLRGLDVYADPVTGEYKIRMPKAKRGLIRTFRVINSSDPVRDMTPLIELAKAAGPTRLFGGLSRQYAHIIIKRYAALAGLHVDMVHCHTLRHSTAMRIWEKTQRPGAISGYLAHTDPASVYQYLRENDASMADEAMRSVLANV